MYRTLSIDELPHDGVNPGWTHQKMSRNFQTPPGFIKRATQQAAEFVKPLPYPTFPTGSLPQAPQYFLLYPSHGVLEKRVNLLTT